MRLGPFSGDVHSCPVASPGHQAGAPLRQRPHRVLLTDSSSFPRPSGRGSIAASWRPARRRRHRPSSPGHQAGAPLRLPVRATDRRRRPPSPGHQAGAPLRRRVRLHLGEQLAGFPRPSGRGSIAARTPSARRPGSASPSPGHQAGAPLRLGHQRARGRPGRTPSPGHQAGAPLRRLDCLVDVDRLDLFPRPSGRGSIAADRGAGSARARQPSPGHQAGAPLRHPRPDGGTRRGRQLPPAIRPGLHCGAVSRSSPLRYRRTFPRPSGRGSIAATAR